MILRSLKFGVAVCLALSAARPLSAQDAASTKNTVQIGDQSVTLPQPILSGDEPSAEAQQELLSKRLRGLPFRQFVRDSVVAPVRIDLDYVKDDDGDRIGHKVHLMFVVYAPLTAFQSDRFSKQIVGDDADKSSEGKIQSETLTKGQLQKLGIDSPTADQSYRKLSFDLLDRIRLTGLFRFQTHSDANQNRLDVTLVPAFDNHWQRVGDAKDNGTYSGFYGWLTATSLIGRDAVLVEACFAMHEPREWFRGDNYLRSKLPLVLQEAARNLRRRLVH